LISAGCKLFISFVVIWHFPHQCPVAPPAALNVSMANIWRAPLKLVQIMACSSAQSPQSDGIAPLVQFPYKLPGKQGFPSSLLIVTSAFIVQVVYFLILAVQVVFILLL